MVEGCYLKSDGKLINVNGCDSTGELTELVDVCVFMCRFLLGLFQLVGVLCFYLVFLEDEITSEGTTSEL